MTVMQLDEDDLVGNVTLRNSSQFGITPTGKLCDPLEYYVFILENKNRNLYLLSQRPKTLFKFINT